MAYYILRRFLLMLPTLLGILLINFVLMQAIPGGPIEKILLAHKEKEQTFEETLLGTSLSKSTLKETQKKLEKQFGFDQPLYKRFWQMVKNYLSFDFGHSYFSNKRVLDLIFERLPVSLSLGLWTTLLSYLLSIPLGIKKALKAGSPFDVWTSFFILLGYATPSFLIALIFIILFAGGDFLSWFPLRGIVSENWHQLSFIKKGTDYFWHITLPVISLAIGSFATLSLLTKHAFLEEIHKNYVLTARAKGLKERRILYSHVFRNAILSLVASFPHTFIRIFFTRALLIEVLFSLDGLGLLGFEATLNHDYPVIFGTLYIFSLLGLLLNLGSDMLYTLVDPRINFQKRAS